MPKSRRRPAAVAKKKAAARGGSGPVPIQRPDAAEEIGTESIGTITAVKQYADDRPAQIELD